MCNCYGCVVGCYEVAEIIFDKKKKMIFFLLNKN